MTDEATELAQLARENRDLRRRLAELETDAGAEKHRPEAALLESEERFRALFANMTSGVAVYQPVAEGTDFVLKDLNEAGARVSHVTREAVVGRLLTEIFPGVRSMGLLDVLRRVSATGMAECLPTVHYSDDRLSHWVENRVFRLPSGEVVAVYDDVTERVQTKERLQESERKFRLLTENSADVIWTMGFDGRLTYVSPSVQKLRGFTAEEVINQPVDQVLTPAARAVVQEALAELQRAIATGAALDEQRVLEIEQPCKDGSTVWTEIAVSVIRDEVGHPVGIQGVSRNITERKRVEGEKRLNEARLESLLRIALSEAADEQALLDLALSEAVSLTSSTLGYLYHYDEGSRRLTLASGSKEVIDPCTVVEPQTVCQLEKTGVWGDAIRQNRPIVINDFTAPNPLEKGLPEGHAPLSRFLALPVHSGSRIIAVVGVANKPADYDSGDVRQLTLLMSSAWRMVEQRRAEQALRASEARFRLLADNAGVGIGCYSPEGRLLYFNSQAASEMGGPADSFVGKTVFELYDRELAATVLERIRSAVASASPMTFEDEVTLPTGRRWVLSTYARVREPDGTVTGVQILSHEVTAQKRVEEALRYQKILHQSQSEASIDGILSVDAAGRVIWSNRRFMELWGMPAHLMASGMDEPMLQFVLDRLQDSQAFLAKVKDLYARPDAKSRDELRLKDGRTFDRYSAPILDEVGTYLGRIWLFRDVTEQKALQASLAQSDRLASMGMLAAGVAHEINNPLSYILYSLESLSLDVPRFATQLAQARRTLAASLGEKGLRDLLGDDVEVLEPEVLSDMEERFKDALEGAQRIKGIAGGLGSFSRVEKDQSALVDLRQPIESAINIAFNEIKYRAHLVKELGRTSPVLASDGRLSQVFLNLLVNAAQAIPEGALDRNRISVRTWQEGSTVFAEVQDTGCGIPEGDLPRIFDPFFTTRPIGGGSGLGLNIVKNIITAYGGTIEATSEVGKGTRFVIELPEASLEDERAEVEAGSRAHEVPGERGRLLVVDDEAGVRAALKRALRGHEVVEADSGERGREVLSRDQGFDVILCDMMMPRVSGMDLHKWLLETHPHLAPRVIFVTGGAFTPGAREYLQKVENLCLDKPFETAKLRKVVAERVSAAKGNRL